MKKQRERKRRRMGRGGTEMRHVVSALCVSHGWRFKILIRTSAHTSVAFKNLVSIAVTQMGPSVILNTSWHSPAQRKSSRYIQVKAVKLVNRSRSLKQPAKKTDP